MWQLFAVIIEEFEKALYEKLGNPGFPMVFVCVFLSGLLIAWVFMRRKG